MDRLVRDRNGVGRRLWRRRKKRTPKGDDAGSEPPVDAHLVPNSDPDVDDEVDISGAIDLAPPVDEVPQRPKVGFWANLRGKLSKKKNAAQKRMPTDPPYLVVDPTREVLAVPRGAARLDAFEKAVKSTPPASPQFRSLALAFHRELQALADGAGVDLSLYEGRVQACAAALIAAGEEERAGALFLRVGRRHQAAEQFLAAGAVDELEEAHALIRWDEGGPKHEARLSFERFEALVVVGLREQALEALEHARTLWGDNPIYNEIWQTFHDRIGAPFRAELASGDDRLVVVGSWPVVIGRGEDAGVRIASPLISRAHLKIEREGAALFIVDLESRGGTRVNGVSLEGSSPSRKTPLTSGAIDIGGVIVHVDLDSDKLTLSPALAPRQRTIAALAGSVRLPAPSGTEGGGVLRFDARGRAFLEPGAVANNDSVKRSLLLLEGDRLGTAGARWTVARRR